MAFSNKPFNVDDVSDTHARAADGDLHQQRSAWTKELDLRPFKESTISHRSIVCAEPVLAAIGTFGSELKDVPAPALGAAAIKAGVARVAAFL